MKSIDQGKRIVIKIGSSSLTSMHGKLAEGS
jgi:glutamate 5-kinase